MVTLSPDQIRYLRLRAQRLGPHDTRAPGSVAELLKDVCGVQAQDPNAAPMAVWVRGNGLVASQIEEAQARERSIVRTWCMRGTLHLLAAQDVGWLLPLLGPVFVRKGRRRYAELGLTEEIRARAVRVIREILGNAGPLTRAELVEHLAGRGIPTQGQAAYHLIRHAALEGVVCFGPERGGEPTFVLLEDWAHPGDAMPADAARAELVRRYLAAYGPAGPEDFSAWSGLPVSQARAGFEAVRDDLLEVDIIGSAAWILKTRAAWLDEGPGRGVAVRLLPAFDPYLLGYQSRDLSVPERYARRVHPGGGMLRPTLLVDGWAAGTWKLKRKGGGTAVVVEPFEALSDQVIDALQGEIRDLGRFYGLEATWSLAAPLGLG